MLLSYWECFTMYSSHLFRGMLLAWNPKKDNFVPYLTGARILLEGWFREMKQQIKILNCYGPYSDRKKILDEVMKSGLLRDPNLIVGGDFNITIFFRGMGLELNIRSID